MTTLRSLLVTLLVSVVASAAPVRIVLLQDKTGSSNWTRTPQLTVEDIDPLIDLLKTNGGEIGIGLIRDTSNRGLVRLRIDAAPDEPKIRQRTGRPYDDLRQAREYRVEYAKWEQLFPAWKNDVEGKIAGFKASVAPLLATNADARATDLWGAVQRADLMLSEPAATDISTHSWLLASTDGGHNRGRVLTRRLRSGARLVVINSAGTFGELAALQPLSFENIRASVRYVIQSERGGR
jgi:hypothetical protein